jgi:hypothetical protein
MDPMSDITMWRRPYLADFGHAMALWPLALVLAKSFADSSQSQSKTKVVCIQHTKYGTAEPFHFLHMDPMSDITMWRRPTVADFGRAMALWHWHCGFKPEPIRNHESLHPAHQAWHC